jgi:hypothetical protein
MPSMTLLIFMGLAVVATLELGVLLAASPAVALSVCLVLATFESYNVQKGVAVQGFSVYPTDLLLAALVVAVVLQILTRGRRGDWRFGALFGLLVFALWRGLSEVGLAGAVNASREMLGFVTAGIYFSSVRVGELKVEQLRRWWIVCSVGITVLGLAFWSANGFGSYATSGARALNSVQALTVLQGILIVVLVPYRVRFTRWAIPLGGAIVILLSAQRTVWIVAVVSLLLLALTGGLSTRHQDRGRTRLLVGTLVVGLTALVAASPSAVSSDLTQATTSATGQDSTFAWRTTRWAELVTKQLDGPWTNLLFGEPAGVQIQIDLAANVAAHSMWVGALAWGGVIGLALLCWLTLGTLSGLWRHRTEPAPELVRQMSNTLLLLLAGLAIWFFSYSTGLLAGIVLGLAAASARWLGGLQVAESSTAISAEIWGTA